MNRRTVLATVGGLAVGTSVASLAGAESDDPDCEPVEIDVAKSGDEVVQTEEVPKAWKEQVEHTRDVQDELGAEYGDTDWYEGTGRTSGDREICDRNEMMIRVRASDPEAARAELGEEYEGVQIEIVAPDGEPEQDLGGQEDGLVDDDGPESNEGADGDSGSTDGGPDGDSDADDADGDDDQSDDSVVGDAPGFGALGALGGLVGAGYLYTRRRANR